MLTTLKPVLISSVALLASFISPLSQADFDLKGTLNITYANGDTKKIDMPLAYKAEGYDHSFTVGKSVYNVSGQPEAYSFALVLQKNNLVWVQEFTKGYFESFEWNIADHKIKLRKKILPQPVMGDYILTIDGNDYFYSNKYAQLTFAFNDEGIDNISVSGMVASFGFKDMGDECATSSESEEETSENAEADASECPPESE